MVHIDKGFRIGFFYTKDKDTLLEIGGEGMARFPCEYAKTATGNVMALLSEKGEVLDVDDIPCDDAFQFCGGTFISFVQGLSDGRLCSAFLVDPSVLSMFAEAAPGKEGELSSIEISGDAFALRVLAVQNAVPAAEVEGSGKYLLLLVGGEIGEDREEKVLTIDSARAALLDIQL